MFYLFFFFLFSFYFVEMEEKSLDSTVSDYGYLQRSPNDLPLTKKKTKRQNAT